MNEDKHLVELSEFGVELINQLNTEFAGQFLTPDIKTTMVHRIEELTKTLMIEGVPYLEVAIFKEVLARRLYEASDGEVCIF